MHYKWTVRKYKERGLDEKMWAAIVIAIVYSIFVFALFRDEPDYRRHKPESGRTRGKFAERLRDLFDEEDDSLN